MILVFGATGQLGRELAPHSDVVCLGRDLADFTHPCEAETRVLDTAAEAVIIAAAYTAVDRAEAEEALAQQINAETPGRIAAACAARGLPLIYVSTDYVFDGSGSRPWRPGDAPAPINAYGRTKWAGEQAVRAAGGPHVILRCSWVVSAHGQNFVKTMLRLGREREQLRVVADQIGGPTPARDLAAACLQIARQLRADPGKTGTYHFAATPDLSWADFARAILARSGTACEVVDIPTTDYPTPAARPGNSRLDCAETETVFGLPQPDWRHGLEAILRDLGERT